MLSRGNSQRPRRLLEPRPLKGHRRSGLSYAPQIDSQCFLCFIMCKMAVERHLNFTTPLFIFRTWQSALVATGNHLLLGLHFRRQTSHLPIWCSHCLSMKVGCKIYTCCSSNYSLRFRQKWIHLIFDASTMIICRRRWYSYWSHAWVLQAWVEAWASWRGIEIFRD